MRRIRAALLIWIAVVVLVICVSLAQYAANPEAYRQGQSESEFHAR